MNLSAVGVDLALIRNSSAFVSARPEADGTIVIREAMELKPKPGQPLKLSEVMPAACDFAFRHGASSMWGDHHLISEARQHLKPGYNLDPVDGGSLARMRRFVIVRGLLVEGRIRIPGQYTKLKQQLRDAVSKPTSGGIINVILRSRGREHSDLLAAFIVAVSMAADPSFGGIPRGFWDEARTIAHALRANLASFEVGGPGVSSAGRSNGSGELGEYGAVDQFSGCEKTTLHDAAGTPTTPGRSPWDF